MIINDTFSSALPPGITRNQAWEIEDLSNSTLIEERRKKRPKQGEYHQLGDICVVKIFSSHKDDSNGVYARFLGLLRAAPGLYVTELVDTLRIVVTSR